MSAKLLLIDDDARLTGMLTDYLRANGFDVEAAGTLAAGRERLRAGAYDALLLDLMLPDGDGLDLTRELRADARHRRLPLLMLTARGDSADRIVPDDRIQDAFVENTLAVNRFKGGADFGAVNTEEVVRLFGTQRQTVTPDGCPLDPEWRVGSSPFVQRSRRSAPGRRGQHLGPAQRHPRRGARGTARARPDPGLVRSGGHRGRPVIRGHCPRAAACQGPRAARLHLAVRPGGRPGCRRRVRRRRRSPTALSRPQAPPWHPRRLMPDGEARA